MYVIKMTLKLSVEALLFASKEPMSINDISIIVKDTKENVSKALRSLIRDYSSRETCLRITRAGIRYKMALKDEFVDTALAVSEPEFPREATEILSFILSSKSPMRGEIKRKFGDEAERWLIDLKRRKIITSEKFRNTEIYSAGRNLYKYFDVSKKTLNEMIDSTEDVKND